MTGLTLYTNPMSRARIVRWMLEEVGEPYETVGLDYGTSMKAADYLAVNPMGKVPAIKHGETVVTEVAAICAYLADAFPAANLAPPTHDRAAYYRWLFFTAGPLEAAVTNRAFGFDAPDKAQSLGYGSYEDALDAAEHAIAPGPFVCGDRFTAADVVLGSQLGYGLTFGTIARRSSFEAYVGRLYARPAALRANELDDAAMPKQEGASA